MSSFGRTLDGPLPRPPQIKRTSTITSRLRVSYPLARIAPADAGTAGAETRRRGDPPARNPPATMTS